VFFSAPASSGWWGSIAAFQGVLKTAEQSKPLWMGEGSFGNTFQNPSNWWQDPYAQGGYVAKYFAALWSNTVPPSSGCSWTGSNPQVCQQAFWYGYDHDVTVARSSLWKTGSFGALYCPGESQGGWCGNSPYPPFVISPQAGMWDVGVGWLTGAVPMTTPFCKNDTTSGPTVWHCDFMKGGVNYSMVWDNSNAGPGVDCSSYTSGPLICGSKTYTVPAGFVGGYWYDLGPNATDPLGGTVTVGLNPILLVHQQ
jgi:hypothetical protein